MSNSPQKQIDNPAFREYLFLLVELERLIRDGLDESPAGDAIYDAMDAPGDRLDGDEIRAVKVFAGDLTRMSERFSSILLPTTAPGRPEPSPTVAPQSPRPGSPADSPKELIP